MKQPAYLFANVLVTNPEQYEQYRVFSSKAIEEFGAQILIRGGEQVVLEGDMYPRTILLKFSDVAQARAFYDSETYRKGREVRKDAAIANLAIIEGVQ